MRLDGNRSLRNLKFYFEIEIFSQYKISVLVGDLTMGPPPHGGHIPHGMVVFQDGYISKELISTSKTDGWTHISGKDWNKIIDFFHFSRTNFTSNFRASKWETVYISIWCWTEQRPIYVNFFFFFFFNLKISTPFLVRWYSYNFDVVSHFHEIVKNIKIRETSCCDKWSTLVKMHVTK